MNQPAAISSPPRLSIKQIGDDTQFVITQDVLINSDAPPDKQFTLLAGTLVEVIDFGPYLQGEQFVFGIRVSPLIPYTHYLHTFVVPVGVVKLVSSSD